MDTFLQQLEKETGSQVRRIETVEQDALKKAFAIALVLAESNAKLKDFIAGYEFQNEKEEIHFFKEVKPLLVSRLIFHSQVYNIEMNRPVGGAAVQREFLHNELANIQEYAARRPEFHNYERMGCTHNDALFFTRNKAEIGQYLESNFGERDTYYSTNCDYKLAKILANKRLEILLIAQLDELEHPHEEPLQLPWATHKTYLVELLYALHEFGAFGKVTLKRVIGIAEKWMGIKLTYHASSFTEMKTRNNSTPFLELLQEALLAKMKREKNKKKR